jgi:hypothetical protein
MKPITVQPQCVMCHGSTEQIPQEVKTMLNTHYPFDRATGYQAGELRGGGEHQPAAGRQR